MILLYTSRSLILPREMHDTAVSLTCSAAAPAISYLLLWKDRTHAGQRRICSFSSHYRFRISVTLSLNTILITIRMKSKHWVFYAGSFISNIK